MKSEWISTKTSTRAAAPPHTHTLAPCTVADSEIATRTEKPGCPWILRLLALNLA